MPKFQRHIFICGNQREAGHPRGSCDPTGEGLLQKAFKKKLAESGIRGDVVRANKSGCLEQCEHGPSVTVNGDHLQECTLERARELLDRRAEELLETHDSNH